MALFPGILEVFRGHQFKPSELGSEDQKNLLGQISESIRATKQIFLFIAGAYVYCTVTVATLDGQGILEHSSIQLPVVNLPVPFNFFFFAIPPLLIFLHCYFYLHLKQLRVLVNKLDTKHRKEVMPWIVSDNLLYPRRNWYDVHSHWVEISLWHFWALNLLLITLFSIKIQDFRIFWFDISMVLVSLIISFFFRQSYYSKARVMSCRYRFYAGSLFIGLAIVALTEIFPTTAIKLPVLKEFMGIDCSNRIFPGVKGPQLSSVIADNRSLRWAKFNSAVMPGFQCDGCNLQNADFSRAYIIGGRMRGSNLAGANFTDATCIGCDFGNSDLSEVRFNRARLDSSKINHSVIERAIFYKTSLVGDTLTLPQAVTASYFYLSTGWWSLTFRRDLEAGHSSLFDPTRVKLYDTP